MKEVVTVKLPEGRLVMLGHKIAQEKVHGILLLSVCVSVAVEAAYRGNEVTGLCRSLPVTPLPLEERGVSLRSTVLHTVADCLISDARLDACSLCVMQE